MQVTNDLIPSKTGQKLLKQQIQIIEDKIDFYQALEVSKTDMDIMAAIQAWRAMSMTLRYMLNNSYLF